MLFCRWFLARVWRPFKGGLGPALILLWCCSCKTGPRIPVFSGQNAFELLQQQCAFGPRYPACAGHDSARAYLAGYLGDRADGIMEQRFWHSDARRDTSYLLTNIVASFAPHKEQRLLLCAHWDTRPWADRDPDPENRDKPILGANDGASGVAVLLEVARLLNSVPPPRGVDIVLFDGEDSGEEGSMEGWCIGSRHFAESKRGVYRPVHAVLLDMVGDKDLDIYVEKHSQVHASRTVAKLWHIAEELGKKAFHRQAKYTVYDDHVPLIENGIPCADVIDFDYPFWHTVEDTPDKCSPESLETVGEVILHLIYGD
jgi:glutaminyl-peptide cyclotransferase